MAPKKVQTKLQFNAVQKSYLADLWLKIPSLHKPRITQ